MASNGKKMQPLYDELKRLDAEIARLQNERAGIARAVALMQGDEAKPEATRKRAFNVKPMVLDIMSAAGPAGATSVEVAARVKAHVPNVAKDTVGSVLSRLKSEGALTYDGERYYEKRFAPAKDGERPFELRSVTAA